MRRDAGATPYSVVSIMASVMRGITCEGYSGQAVRTRGY